MTRISKIAWGDNFETDLLIGYPLQSVLTDRPLRENYQAMQAMKGSQVDAWRSGRDSWMQADARWIPNDEFSRGGMVQTPSSGSASWQDFLDWARDQNQFRLVPDIRFPDFWVPNCYLDQPQRGFGEIDTPAGDRRAQLTILSTSGYDFRQALRGVMLDYAPGGLLELMTFSRSTVALQVGADGLPLSAAVNVLRDRHFIGGSKTALVELGTTNLVENNDLESDATGVVANQSTLVRDTTQFRFGTASAKVTTQNLNNSGLWVRKRAGSRIDATVGTAYSWSLWYYAPAASVGKTFKLGIEWYDSGGVVITVPLSAQIPLVAGWNRVKLENQVAPANTVTCIPRFYTDSSQGIFDFWAEGMQFEANPWSTSEILTNTGALTRQADAGTFAWPWAASPGFAGWFYVSFIEVGLVNSVTFKRVLGLGSSGTAGARNFNLRMSSIPSYSVAHELGNGTGGVSSNIPGGNNPVYGDLVELLGILFPDGSVKIIQSKNGGAEVSGTQSGAASATIMAIPTWNGNLMGLVQQGGSGASGAVALRRVKAGLGSAVSSIALARAA